jgi:hypothetical protein
MSFTKNKPFAQEIWLNMPKNSIIFWVTFEWYFGGLLAYHKSQKKLTEQSNPTKTLFNRFLSVKIVFCNKQ